MKVLGFDFHAAKQGTAQDSHATPEGQVKNDRPLHEKIDELRKENHKIAGSLHYRLNIEHKDINYRLNLAVGISTIKNCDNLGKLQRRYDLARRWLMKGVAPEVSFND